MNLSLVDPFVLAQDCPDVITGRLRAFFLCAPLPTYPHMANISQAAVTAHQSASATAATCSPPDGYATPPPAVTCHAPRPLTTAPSSTMASSSSSTLRRMASPASSVAIRARYNRSVGPPTTATSSALARTGRWYYGTSTTAPAYAPSASRLPSSSQSCTPTTSPSTRAPIPEAVAQLTSRQHALRGRPL